MRVELDQPEWNSLLAILAQAPWNVANPLIMRIGEQLRAQAGQIGEGHVVNPSQADHRGNSGDHRDR